MIDDAQAVGAFLATLAPYDALDEAARAEVASAMRPRRVAADETIHRCGDRLDGRVVVVSGRVEVRDEQGRVIGVLTPGQSVGERGLLAEGRALTDARALEPSELLVLPREDFERLRAEEPAFARTYERRRTAESPPAALTALAVAELMTTDPVTCAPGESVAEAARRMRERAISCLPVIEAERLVGVVTSTDLVHRALAEDRPGATTVGEVMTRDPVTLAPDALGADVLMLMLERGFGHLPVMAGARLAGIVSRTDLTRFQATTSGQIVRAIRHAADRDAIAAAVRRLPDLLAQLVGTGNRHEAVTRLVTAVADAATRRLIALAAAEFGAAPVAYVWLACGSQGRREQTGVSDQDNCLMLDDAATEEDMAYFERLAGFVCDGLDRAGYYLCPGEMMATNPRWRARVADWRRLFEGWIRRPDAEAQMLASVMFDLRAIGGEARLYEDLQHEVLEQASRRSFFVAHMTTNALTHQPPLGLFGRFQKQRRGRHRDVIDLKMNGVVPVVDLGRLYALKGALPAANTRARLLAAQAKGLISATGGRDLIDAYDAIADARLDHQASQIRAGQAPDNFLPLSTLSDFEQAHLHDAFSVVRRMQSAAGHVGSAIR
ncbi:MAG: DUF294 nucleotidyltransferase-like domain-containing protein [Paracoccaceae bacterium]